MSAMKNTRNDLQQGSCKLGAVGEGGVPQSKGVEIGTPLRKVENSGISFDALDQSGIESFWCRMKPNNIVFLK